MFNWIKKLLGFTEPKKEPLILTDSIKYQKKIETQERPTETAHAEPKKRKKESVDFDSMTKKQLLAEAKKRGVKANASLSKSTILERIKNGD